jgi:hypothetical protein
MVRGNPRIRAAPESVGCEVHGYEGSEISLKGDGGPTCLTSRVHAELRPEADGYVLHDRGSSNNDANL